MSRHTFLLSDFKKTEVYIWFKYFILFFILLLLYSKEIVDVYEYMGFLDNLRVENIFFSTLLILTILPFLRQNGRPSSFFLNIAAGLICVPSLVIYSGSGLPHWFAIATISCFLIVAIVTKLVHFRPVSFGSATSHSLLPMLIIFSIGTIVAIVLLGGARFFNLNFSAVYDIRRDAEDNLPGIFGYLNSLTTKVIIPFGIVFSLYHKKWLFAIIFSSISFLFFALTAHKSPIFYPLVVIMTYLLTYNGRLNSYFISGLIIIAVLGLVDMWLYTNGGDGIAGWFTSLFVRRTLLVPSLLNWYYLDFFSGAEKYFWADSKLTFGLIKPSHELKPVNLIGVHYFGNELMSANTGWIGSGYANAGIIGLILYSLLVGLLLSLFDAFSHFLGDRIIISVFTIPVMNILTSSDLTTMFLTHGLIFAIGFLFITRLPKG